MRCGIRIMLLLLFVALPARAAAPAPSGDARLERARRFVEASDRYLHHSQFKRGMKGYGLTVFAGAKIERFDVEILSVVHNTEPGRDMILAMLSGKGLDVIGVAQGMSGSPVFIIDPKTGTDKMIGAVAYGWPMAKEPICGIQPITQMLAMPGILPRGKARPDRAKPPRPARTKPATASQPVKRPDKPKPAASQPASQPATKPTAASQPASPPATKPAAVSQPVLPASKHPASKPAGQATRPATRPETKTFAIRDGVLIVHVRPDGSFALGEMTAATPEELQTQIEQIKQPTLPVHVLAGKGQGLAPALAAVKAARAAGHENVALRVVQSQPSSAPATQPAATQPAEAAPAPAEATETADDAPGGGAARSAEGFLQRILLADKADFTAADSPRRLSSPLGMNPLLVPLSVAPARPELVERLSGRFEAVGLRPVAGGSAGGAEDLDAVKLEPGSTLAVPLVTGDADWTAIGTVTDVLGKRVIGFGHQMFGEGTIDLPMATGYVHAVIPSMMSSFKLGSAIRPVGRLGRDEFVAVGGTVGPRVQLIPMRMKVDQASDSRVRTFDYQLVREWFFTPRLAAGLVMTSAEALRTAPQFHHIRYHIQVDFGPLGVYEVHNVSSNSRTAAVESDLARALDAMLNTPFGRPPPIKSIDVSMTIRKGDISGRIVDARLDADLVRPGQTVSGSVLLERFRKDRTRVAFQLALPKDLPAGTYQLTVCDWYTALRLRQDEQPQMFDPKTTAELLRAVQRVTSYPADRLYLHLPLDQPGMALGPAELDSLPGGRARLLRQAQLPRTRETKPSLRDAIKQSCVIEGSRTLTFTVKDHLNEHPVRPDSP